MAKKEKQALLLQYRFREQFDLLEPKKAKKLILAIIDYDEKSIIPKLDSVTNMAFSFIKKELDKNKKEYQKKCEKNAINSRKYWANKHKQAKENKVTERIQSVSNDIERIQTISDYDNDYGITINSNTDINTCEVGVSFSDENSSSQLSDNELLEQQFKDKIISEEDYKAGRIWRGKKND